MLDHVDTLAPKVATWLKRTGSDEWVRKPKNGHLGSWSPPMMSTFMVDHRADHLQRDGGRDRYWRCVL